MKKLFVLMMLFCSLSHSTYSQSEAELRFRIQKIVNKIEQENIYKSAAVGYGAVRTAQWNRFEKMKKEASELELVMLTDHQNPVVRSYAFQALAERQSNATFEILLNHLADTAQLQTLQGCFMSSQTVGDFFLEVVTPRHISLEAYKLNREQRKTVDSLLLYDDKAKTRNRSALLQRLEKDRTHYERIRKIYLKEQDPHALVALSKFRLEQDKPFIIDWLTRTKTRDQYHGIMAARYFPDEEIYPLLVKIHQQEINKPGGFNYPLIRMLYCVLVQYPTEQTRKLLELSLQTKGATYRYHAQYIWLALEKYPHPAFEGIQERIALTEFQLNSLSYWLEGDDG